MTYSGAKPNRATSGVAEVADHAALDERLHDAVRRRVAQRHLAAARGVLARA